MRRLPAERILGFEHVGEQRIRRLGGDTLPVPSVPECEEYPANHDDH